MAKVTRHSMSNPRTSTRPWRRRARAAAQAWRVSMTTAEPVKRSVGRDRPRDMKCGNARRGVVRGGGGEAAVVEEVEGVVVEEEEEEEEEDGVVENGEEIEADIAVEGVEEGSGAEVALEARAAADRVEQGEEEDEDEEEEEEDEEEDEEEAAAAAMQEMEGEGGDTVMREEAVEATVVRRLLLVLLLVLVLVLVLVVVEGMEGGAETDTVDAASALRCSSSHWDMVGKAKSPPNSSPPNSSPPNSSPPNSSISSEPPT